MATIKDIAKLADVSIATVSNVLNGKSGAASQKKIKEIYQIVESLNYQPNSLAKSLKTQKSKTIGIIAEDLTVYQSAEIINGIEEHCEKHGYSTLLVNMRLFKRFGNNLAITPEHATLFENAMSSLRSRQVEGFIYIGYHCRKIPFTPSCSHLPFVYAYCIPENKDYPYLLFDDENTSLEIGRALIAQGHKHIGIISGPISNPNSQSRLTGIQRALFEASIPYDVTTTATGDWTRESGYESAKLIIPKGVTAIYAFNDMMASGVYSYCIEKGLVVGRDISLFGYDNQIIVNAYDPPLSSAEPHLNEMGQKASELILLQLQGTPVPAQGYILPCTLHLRNSITSPV